ncbi:MAG: PAS domain S-box protein [Candidatus Izemoplasmatales bacterium]|nr:PAS domain S-box protein [Candidatus Izemoplasmatales bacterium]MDD4355301.1 PAS domain S-box protein [Candidatus Izemoplasmatales bacterium]MDY0373427.1 PAS domain S-box protein [Candidatus Izemoplasmatales bacterium]
MIFPYFFSVLNIVLYIILSITTLVFGLFAFYFHHSSRYKKESLNLNEDYSSLVENYAGMAYRCLNDEFWTMKFLSQKSADLIGYTPEEVIDNKVISFEEIIMPRYRKELRDKWHIAIQLKSDFISEYQIKTKSGIVKWVQETGHVIYGKNGIPEYIEGFIRDITEEHEIAIKEKKSEGKYRNLIETIQDPIFIDEEGILIYVNPACVRFFRAKSEADLLGKHVVDIILPEYLQFYRDRYDRLSRTKLPNPRADYAFLRFDGTIAYAEVSSSPHFDNGDMSVHVLIYDITEKKFRTEQLRRIQKRNRDLILQMSEGIGIFNQIGDSKEKQLIYANRSFAKILYGSQRKVIGQTLLGLFGDSTNQVQLVIASAFDQQLQTTQQIPFDNRVLQVKAFFNDDNELVLMIADITDLVHYESKLMQERNRLQTIIKGTNTAIWELDWASGILIVNDRWKEIVGYPPEAVLPLTFKTWVDMIHPDDSQRFVKAFNRLLAKETDDIYEEVRIHHSHGRPVWTFIRGSLNDTPTNSGQVIFSGILQDITDHKEKELEILHLSYYDHLTGLFNRRKYEEILQEVDCDNCLPLSVIMTDVDALKITNDAFGHQAGDYLLKHITEKLLLHFPPEVYISRIGGDEFVILWPNMAFNQAKKSIDQLNENLKKEVINGIPCSVSFGVATRTLLTQDVRDAIRDAEMIMYNSKLMKSRDYRSDIIEKVKMTFFENHPEERIHANLVKKYLFQLGNEFHLSESDLNSLLLLAEIHDIGKISVSSELLLKPLPLADDEIKQIQRHSEIGYRILASSYEYDKIALDVLAHHERWDGKGYPKKISEDEIPWKARFLSICEAFSSMIQTFPYRQKLSILEASQEIIRHSGTQFDPEIARVFIEKVLKIEWKSN